MSALVPLFSLAQPSAVRSEQFVVVGGEEAAAASSSDATRLSYVPPSPPLLYPPEELPVKTRRVQRSRTGDGDKVGKVPKIMFLF